MEINRDFEAVLERRLHEPLNFIQVIVGPRQVGKTTGVKRVFSNYPAPKHFATADSPIPLSAEWLRSQWEHALQLGKDALLVVDEVQKISGWAEVCKLLFDQNRKERSLRVVLLASASLSIQEGLASALAGRFELISVPHWSFAESQTAFKWDLTTFLKFGGYPAAAELISERERWQTFMRDSVIDPVLGRDISGLVRINKPALFRQTFRLAMSYPAQVLSYQKILGQLQEGGNASTVKHYLELFEGAFLLKLVEKYSGSPLVSVATSPKIVPLAPALSNALLDDISKIDDPTWQGRLFEAFVGARLLKLPGRLFYWSQGNYEVDYVRKVDDELIAYEVKSGLTHRAKSLELFKQHYPEAKVVVVDRQTVERL